MAYPQYTENWDFNTPVEDDSNWVVEASSNPERLVADTDDVWIPWGTSLWRYKGYAAIYQDTCDSVSQCVKLEVKNQRDNGNTYGAILRAANADGSGAQYICTIRHSGSAWEFSVERLIGVSHQETIGTRIGISAPSDGDWVGFAVTGTGNDTVFDYWDFGGSAPGDFSSWGSVTQSQTANPGTALDTGDYVGMYMYHGSGVDSRYAHEVDTWVGGDQAASGPETKTITSSLDALVQKTLTTDFVLDSLLQKNIPVTLSIDGILALLKTIQSSAVIDSILFAALPGTLQNGFIDHLDVLDSNRFARVLGGSGSVTFADSYADINCASTSDSAFLYYKTKISKTKNSIFRICLRVQADSAIPDVLGLYRDTGSVPAIDTESNIQDNEFVCGLSITDAGSPYVAFKRLTGLDPSTFSTDNLNTTDAPNIGASEDFYILGLEVDGDNGKIRGHLFHLPTSQFQYMNTGLTLINVTAWEDIPAAVTETEFYVCIGNRYSDVYADRYHVEWAYHEEVTNKVHAWVNSTSSGGTYDLRHMWGYGTQFMPDSPGSSAIAIAKGGGGSWNDIGYRGKFCIKDGATYYMFLEGGGTINFPDSQMGVWTATDPNGAWTPDGGNPILSPSTIIGSGYTSLQTMWVIKDEDEADSNWRWKMLVSATKSSFAPRLFLLYSSSPTSGWNKYTGAETDGAVLDASGSGWRQDGVNEPTIIWDIIDGNWKLFIPGLLSGSGWSIGLFESDDLKSWSVPGGVSNPIITAGSIRDDVVSSSGKEITVDDGSIYTEDAALALTDLSNVNYSRIRKVTGNVLELYHEIAGVGASIDIEQVGQASITPMFIEYQNNISKWVLTTTVFQPFILKAGFEASELVGRYTADSLAGPWTQDFLNTLPVPRENSTSGAHISNENLRLVTYPHQTKSEVSLDAYLQKQFLKLSSIDGLLQKEISQSLFLDSLLSKTIPVIISIDSILSALRTIETSIDAQVFKEYTEGLSLDGLLQKLGVETSLSIDSLLQEADIEKSLSIDSLLQKSGLATLSIDAVLNKIGATIGTSLDSILYEFGQEIISTSIDAKLSKIGLSVNSSIDALLLKAGLTNSTTIDALLSKLGVTGTVSLDAILFQLGTGAYTTSIDALLQDIGVLATLNIDTLLQRSLTDTSEIDALLIKTITASLSADAMLSKSQTGSALFDGSLYHLRTIDTTIDAILSGFSGSTALLDALLLSVGRTINATLDASIYRNVLKTASIDSILKGTLSRQINIDALLNGVITSSSLLDAVIYSILIQANPFAEFITTETKPAFIEIEAKPDFVFQLD